MTTLKTVCVRIDPGSIRLFFLQLATLATPSTCTLTSRNSRNSRTNDTPSNPYNPSNPSNPRNPRLRKQHSTILIGFYVVSFMKIDYLIILAPIIHLPSSETNKNGLFFKIFNHEIRRIKLNPLR
jgi:hypothetical protein